MRTIVHLSGHALRELVGAALAAEEEGYILRVAIDDGLKVALGGQMWSPPFGDLWRDGAPAIVRAEIDRDAPRSNGDPDYSVNHV